MLHQPAPSRATTALQGRAHWPEAYRGKVVLLDFWYRGRGYCMLAMLAIKTLHERCAGRPVVMLSISADEKVEDMRFVAVMAGITRC